MKKIYFFLIFALLSNQIYAHGNDNSKPNIIFILVDDLGKEWVECYGAEDIKTPNIDKLAHSGVLFHNFYVMPQCTPTRVSFLTGQYPFRHGWVNHWDVPRWGGAAHFDEIVNPCIGIEMKKAGYKTCIAGKWQIDDFRVEPDALSKCGFDEYCMWTGGEGGNPKSNERYHSPYIFTKKGSRIYNEKFGPDIFKDFIIDFIHKNKTSPFFIYYPMVLTHTPLINPPRESAGTDIEKHKAMVRYTDKITGEIVKALDKGGISENTIIIWSTDNGSTRKITGTLNGTKINGGKSQTSENGINVPFIISWPGKLKPGTSDALIDVTDLYPTFIDIATGSYKSSRENHVIDGISFKNILFDNAAKSNRKWIMAMGGQNNARLTENGVENQYKFRDRVLRTERFKLYIDTRQKPNKFFDLKTDPLEEKNLINELTTSERKKNFKLLSSANNTFPEKDNDPIYIPNPKQNWDVNISAKSQIWKK